jgi:hypothetical protein
MTPGAAPGVRVQASTPKFPAHTTTVIPASETYAY